MPLAHLGNGDVPKARLYGGGHTYGVLYYPCKLPNIIIFRIINILSRQQLFVYA